VGETCQGEEDTFNATLEKRVFLDINACNEQEFNCDDGFCVNIDQRCDGKVDCPDKSDEISCNIFTTDESYLKEVPPPGEKRQKLLDVVASVDILKILNVRETSNIIALQIQLRLTWLDRRLKMFNLKQVRISTKNLDLRSLFLAGFSYEYTH